MVWQGEAAAQEFRSDQQVCPAWKVRILVMRPGGGEEIYYWIADWLSLRRLRAQRTNGSRA